MVVDVLIAREALILSCTCDEINEMSASWLSHVGCKPLRDRHVLLRSLFERVPAVALINLASPVLAAIVATVGLNGRAPPLCKRRPPKLQNALFTKLKRRTTRERSSDIVVNHKVKGGDHRAARFVQILRTTSLDALSQLINTILGDTSLLAQPCHAPSTTAVDKLVREVAAEHPLQRSATSGINKWPQVTGWRGATRTRLRPERRIANAAHHNEEWSIWPDLKLNLKPGLHQFTA